MADLVAETFAPWSEKARWALDHHRVPYRWREYVPMVGEPWLRLRLRDPFGPVSVPALIGDGAPLRDSLSIAEHADRIGSGTKLLPPSLHADVLGWNDRSERALRANRVRVVVRMAEVPGAKAEALPPGIPAALRPVLAGTTGLALAFLRRKYALGSDVDASQAILRAALEDLRGALGGRQYLLGDFSYADVTMAVVLQGIRPVADELIPLGPATREVWSNDELAREFADLLRWRDALYARHRRASATGSRERRE
jgi:glutathione S-transferase